MSLAHVCLWFNKADHAFILKSRESKEEVTLLFTGALSRDPRVFSSVTWSHLYLLMEEQEAAKTQFYCCSCFSSDNIYVEDYRLHVRFVTEQQFRLEHRQVSVCT